VRGRKKNARRSSSVRGSERGGGTSLPSFTTHLRKGREGSEESGSPDGTAGKHHFPLRGGHAKNPSRINGPGIREGEVIGVSRPRNLRLHRRGQTRKKSNLVVVEVPQKSGKKATGETDLTSLERGEVCCIAAGGG